MTNAIPSSKKADTASHIATIKEATLFSCELACEIVEGLSLEERRKRTNGILKIEGRFGLVDFGSDPGAQYMLEALLAEGILNIKIEATYFVLSDFLSEADEGRLEDHFRGVGAIIVWARFRDLAMQMVSQGGWIMPAFPPTFPNLTFIQKSE